MNEPAAKTQGASVDPLALALARLREGTEVLRTGGGTTLTASQCSVLLDERDRYREALVEIAESRTAPFKSVELYANHAERVARRALEGEADA